MSSVALAAIEMGAVQHEWTFPRVQNDTLGHPLAV